MHPAPLNPEGFAPFGTMLRFDPAVAIPVNANTAQRADLAALFDAAPDTSPRLALYRAAPQTLPIELSTFERHPVAAQTFLSVSVQTFLVVVAPPGRGGLPDPAQARAFLGERGTGLSYRPDQWHAPILAIGGAGDLLMLTAVRGDITDCIEHRLAEPITILES